jgi:serine/threonine protein kinase/WD40 repeat protein
LCTDCLWNDDASPPDDPPGPAIRFRVPGHEVLEEIARGGMGVVYRARERKTQRIVALKMLRPRLADEDGMRERFRLEASAAAALHHPAILPVYRVDESENMPFFTMKLAGGGTLAERRDHFHGRWREIAGLMITLAGAVQHAHQHGVLHRDLKPANVVFDDDGRAYLTDFGLVKLIDGVSDLTGSQGFLGTPHYASPEVAASSAGAATVASDVWSLGAILYELLAGHPPFEAPGLASLLRRVAEDPPAPMSAAEAVPADLRVIASTCLQKDPAKRYPSAAAMAADLQAWLDGRPISARTPSVSERLTAWSRRNPLIATLAAALFVSLVLLASLLWRDSRISRKAAIEARLSESAARAAEAAALLEETRARVRDGQWVDRKQAVAAVLRSHELQPSAAAREVLVSVLALPTIEETGKVPYSHDRPVFFSGDLSRYVTKSQRSTTIRETATGNILFAIPEAAAPTHPPGPLSPDGRKLMLRTTKYMNIWDVETATKSTSFPPGTWPAGFSADSGITATGRHFARLAHPPADPIAIAGTDCEAHAISPDGKLILMTHLKRLRIQLVDTTTGSSVRDCDLPGASIVHCAVWTADSRQFFTGLTDGRIAAWSTDASAPSWIIPAHTDGVDSLALFDDGRHLITQGRDGLTKIWDLRNHTNVFTLPWSGLRVMASSDGRNLAVDSAPAKKTILYHFAPPPVCVQVRLPASRVPNSYLQGEAAVIPAADSRSFAVTAGSDLHFLDREGTPQKSLPCGRCDDLVPHPSGAEFIRSEAKGRVHTLFRVPPGWPGPWNDESLVLGKWSNEVVLLPDATNHRLLLGNRGRITVLDPPPDGTRPPAALPTYGRVTAMAFSPDGTMFAWAGGETSADRQSRIHIMDAAGGREISRIPLPVAPRVIAFTADSTAILCGDNDRLRCRSIANSSELWSVPHSRPQTPLLRSPVCIAVAAQSGIIAAPLAPDSVSLLDGKTGRVRLTLRHPMHQIVRAIGLSPDGTRLLAVGSYVVHVWRLDAVAEELAHRGMPLPP